MSTVVKGTRDLTNRIFRPTLPPKHMWVPRYSVVFQAWNYKTGKRNQLTMSNAPLAGVNKIMSIDIDHDIYQAAASATIVVENTKDKAFKRGLMTKVLREGARYVPREDDIVKIQLWYEPNLISKLRRFKAYDAKRQFLNFYGRIAYITSRKSTEFGEQLVVQANSCGYQFLNQIQETFSLSNVRNNRQTPVQLKTVIKNLYKRRQRQNAKVAIPGERIPGHQGDKPPIEAFEPWRAFGSEIYSPAKDPNTFKSPGPFVFQSGSTVYEGMKRMASSWGAVVFTRPGNVSGKRGRVHGRLVFRCPSARGTYSQPKFRRPFMIGVDVISLDVKEDVMLAAESVEVTGREKRVRRNVLKGPSFTAIPKKPRGANAVGRDVVIKNSDITSEAQARRAAYGYLDAVYPYVTRGVVEVLGEPYILPGDRFDILGTRPRHGRSLRGMLAVRVHQHLSFANGFRTVLDFADRYIHPERIMGFYEFPRGNSI